MSSNESYHPANVVLNATDENLVRMIASPESGGRLEAVKAEITVRGIHWQKEAAASAKTSARWSICAAVAAILSVAISAASLAWQIWGHH